MSSEQPSSPVNSKEESAIEPDPALGWNTYAERINGRFAMIGFVALLILEFFTHQDFFTWVGLR